MINITSYKQENRKVERIDDKSINIAKENENNRICIREKIGIEYIINVLNQFLYYSDLSVNILGVLHFLSVNSENAEYIREKGGIYSIIGSMIQGYLNQYQIKQRSVKNCFEKWTLIGMKGY